MPTLWQCGFIVGGRYIGKLVAQKLGIKLYDKELDYIWLLKMVKIFKYGVYKMLYTKILTCEIDEAQLKNVLKCWV